MSLLSDIQLSVLDVLKRPGPLGTVDLTRETLMKMAHMVWHTKHGSCGS
jgi:hypothetical protein